MGGSTRSLFNPHLIAVGGQVGSWELVPAANGNYHPYVDENDCIDSPSPSHPAYQYLLAALHPIKTISCVTSMKISPLSQGATRSI